MVCDSSVTTASTVAGAATAHNPGPASPGSGSSRRRPCTEETHAAMGFINEVVSDADIDRYGLPFRKGSGRWWTRDRERDLYLWGGLSGNPAFDEPILGIFQLHLAGETYEVVLRPGAGSMNYSETPYVIAWESVIEINPSPGSSENREEILSVLRQGLVVYGEDGMENKYAPIREIICSF